MAAKIKGKYIDFNDVGTTTSDAWSADKIISYYATITNPFDQDLNTTDNVTFNSVDITSGLYLPTTTTTDGIIYQDSNIIFHTYGTDNLYLGKGTGNFTSTGTGENIGIGIDILKSVTTGYRNFGAGNDSLNKLTSGTGNVAIGEGAMKNSLTATGNFAFGLASLYDTNGAWNVAIGNTSQRLNETGDGNVGIGISTLYSNVSGDYNTAIGYGAGYGVLGTGNVLLGHFAGFVNPGSNKLYIANSNTATPLIYGEFDNGFITINGDLTSTGTIKAAAYKSSDGSAGATTTFTTHDSKTVTVKNGLIVSVV